MAKINIYNFEGQVVGTEDLNSKVFEVQVKPELIHFVVNGLMANSRQVSAHTKTRGEVSGGGKKPWKQKGTGRARQGSIRSPLWRGGGVVFGPRPERNFKVKINRKTKQTVLNMVLSDKVKANALILLESFDLPEAKTKAFVKMMKTLPVVGKKVLVVFSAKKDNLRRASKNLPSVNQENLEELNLLDILNADTVLTTAEAVKFWQKNK
ncbi:MAG: 50S ribosomal protein L4 [Patescibacteria group bacterium]